MINGQFGLFQGKLFIWVIVPKLLWQIHCRKNQHDIVWWWGKGGGGQGGGSEGGIGNIPFSLTSAEQNPLALPLVGPLPPIFSLPRLSTTSIYLHYSSWCCITILWRFQFQKTLSKWRFFLIFDFFKLLYIYIYVHYSMNTIHHRIWSRIFMIIHYKYATWRKKKHKTQNTTHCGTMWVSEWVRERQRECVCVCVCVGGGSSREKQTWTDIRRG